MEKKKNADLSRLYYTTNLQDFLRSNAWRAEGILIRSALIKKPNKKGQVERPRQRWMDRVRDDLKSLRIRTSIEDAENRKHQRTLVEIAKRLNGA